MINFDILIFKVLKKLQTEAVETPQPTPTDHPPATNTAPNKVEINGQKPEQTTVTRQYTDEEKEAYFKERDTRIVNTYVYLFNLTNGFTNVQPLLPPAEGETPEYKKLIEAAKSYIENKAIRNMQSKQINPGGFPDFYSQHLFRLSTESVNYLTWIYPLMFNIASGSTEKIKEYFERFESKRIRINQYVNAVAEKLNINIPKIEESLPKFSIKHCQLCGCRENSKESTQKCPFTSSGQHDFGEKRIIQPGTKTTVPMSQSRLDMLRKYTSKPNQPKK